MFFFRIYDVEDYSRRARIVLFVTVSKKRPSGVVE
jgi:hypothetical protein